MRWQPRSRSSICYPERTDGHDVSDWLKHDAVGAKLFEAVKAAPEWEPGDEPMAGDGKDESEIAVEISRLAELPAIKYEQERKDAAEGAWGSRVHARPAGAGRAGAAGPRRWRQPPLAGARGRAARAEAVRGSSGRREPAR